MAAEPATEKSISGTFRRLRENGQVRGKVESIVESFTNGPHCALIPFICAGDPTLEATKKALLALDAAGADIIELGVPYSDPLADGPVIQAAATRALAKGTTLMMVLDMLKEVSPSIKAPIVLFTYFNPIMRLGAEAFIKEIKARGASGLVVPDIPLEETAFLRDLTTANGIELVLLVTPTTPESRMADIAVASQGFVYLVSVTGVTGVRAKVESRVEKLLGQLRAVTDKPIGVGFGISKPEDAAQVRGWGADGVIAGSAFVRLLGEAANPDEGVAAVSALAASLKKAITS